LAAEGGKVGGEDRLNDAMVEVFHRPEVGALKPDPADLARWPRSVRKLIPRF
jgi:hypothetical protein